MHILLLRHKTAQRHLSTPFSWRMTLKNKLHGKESALFWSVAFTSGHMGYRKNKTQE
jgi:hypothetical protein